MLQDCASDWPLRMLTALSAQPTSFKMTVIHKILCKLSLQGDHSRCIWVSWCLRPLDAEGNAVNIEIAMKTEGVALKTVINILAICQNAQTGYYLCLPERDRKRTSRDFKVGVIWLPVKGHVGFIEENCSEWCFWAEGNHDGPGNCWWLPHGEYLLKDPQKMQELQEISKKKSTGI